MKITNIPPIERASVHIDIAFRRAKTKAELVKKRLKGKLTIPRIREIERTRFATAAESLVKRLKKIVNSFPDVNILSPFYQELMKATLDVPALEKSLSSIQWLSEKIAELQSQYRRKLNRSRTQTEIHNIRSSFYGRLSSLCTKHDGEFACLDKARKVMRSYPIIRNIPTVAIVGFPNVGKTTLLSKLSSSTPEIAEYAFTTKHVNLGYIQFGHNKIQLVDTPGTLSRVDKMNAIEKQAMIAIKYLAHALIYVFDPTEPYPLERQEQLLALLENEKKQIILYMSKADTAKEHEIAKVVQKHKEIIFSPDLVKQRLQALVF